MYVLTENLFEVMLESNYTQQAEIFGFVVIGQEVDVGGGSIVTARDRTEEAQVEEAGGSELRLVLTQDGEDALLIHVY